MAVGGLTCHDLDAGHSLIDTNLNGTFHLIHAILPHFRTNKDGLVINVTSISGKRTISDLAGAGYCASKVRLAVHHCIRIVTTIQYSR